MTTPNELQELIQADVDGVASATDRTRLDLLLATDPVAREEHARLLRLRDLLSGIPPVPPPPELAANVMRRVRAERAPAGGGIARRLFGPWPSVRIAIPYAYAAAAGAAVAILGYHVLSGGGPLGPDGIEREAAATIGSVPLGVETGRMALVADGVSGSATLRSLDGNVAIDIELPAGAPLDVSVDYDPGAVKFLGISNRTGGLEEISVAGGTVRWAQSQPQRVTVFLAPRAAAPSQLTVRFAGAGGIAGGGTMDLPGRR